MYRSTSSGGYYQPIDSTYSDYYYDNYLNPWTTYYYKVSAVDYYGYESGLSDYTYATTYLSAPYGVSATALSSSSIQVSWYYLSGADYYKLYRATSVYGPYSCINNTYGTSYTDYYLSSGTYYYKVSAYNYISGESELSDYAEVTISY